MWVGFCLLARGCSTFPRFSPSGPSRSLPSCHPHPASPQRKYGFIMGGDGSVLAAALVCIVVVAAWVLAIMTPFFMVRVQAH